MAWNEPGDNSNNNDRDPWGGRRGGGGGGGDRKGPPDLDEAFRKLQDSLNGLFGGKTQWQRFRLRFRRQGRWPGPVRHRPGDPRRALAVQRHLCGGRAGAGGHPALRQVLRDGRSRPELLLPADRQALPGERHPRACVQQAGADAHRGREHRRSAADRAVQDQQPAGLRAQRRPARGQPAAGDRERAAACRRLHHHGPDPHRRPRADGDRGARAPATLPGYLQDRYHRDPGEHPERPGTA